MSGWTFRVRTACAAGALALSALAAAQEATSPLPESWRNFRCAKPRYPQGALSGGGAEGTTRVVATIEPDGTVSSVRVVQRSGDTYAHGLLDQSAVDSLMACRFPPPPEGRAVRGVQDFGWVLQEPDPLPAQP